jgi:hypothetical protein
MAVDKENLEDILKTEPLSELSRKERKMLLLMSVIAIAVSKAGLAPTKIVGFGIEFSNINRTAILALLFGAVLYFWVTFIYCALPDFYSWRLRYNKYRYDCENEHARLEEEYGPDYDVPAGPQPEPSVAFKKGWERYKQSHTRFKQVVLTKLTLDMAIPILVGIGAMFFSIRAL